PAVVQPATEDYRIGTNDLLDVQVFGEPQLSGQFRVSNTGNIHLPFIDADIHAQCLTEIELTNVVADKMKKYLKNPQIHINVKEYDGNSVSIIGAVHNPSKVQLDHTMSLFDLLIQAGGPADTAGKSVV